MLSLYRIFLALHIISIICWMAGLLYLYRLFVYHAQETEQVVKERFAIMERRLYSYITNPSMIASFIFGAAMIGHNMALLDAPWMRVKLFLVALLIGTTHFAKRWGRQLQQGTSQKTHRFFRIANEVPTLLMVGIVLLVILRPF